MWKKQKQTKKFTLGTNIQCPMNNSKGYIRGKITTLFRSKRKEGIVLTDTGVYITVLLAQCVILNEKD
jgi:hypothetical protein